jgi:hypothetical protein
LGLPGDVKQHLVLLARCKPLHKLVDGARLVALGLVAGDELEVHGGIIARKGEDWANNPSRWNGEGRQCDEEVAV